VDDVVETVARHWDGRAATFDDEPDHGLADPATRAAWRDRLAVWLPSPPARVADLGCGTGSLAVLLASMGYDVAASDISPAMVQLARHKAELAEVRIEVTTSDAGHPDLPERSVDVVLVRHLAWTLPQPLAALDRWAALLRPAGRLVMVEGRWGTAAQDPHGDDTTDHGDYTTVHHGLPWYRGVGARTLVPALEQRFARVECHDLSHDASLWGREVTDERYAVVAHVS
jgi:SAM-dependent methyltransferase